MSTSIKSYTVVYTYRQIVQIKLLNINIKYIFLSINITQYPFIYLSVLIFILNSEWS